MSEIFKNPLLTIDEVSAALRCCPGHVYRLLSDKKLKAKKFGRKTLIMADSLEAYINAQPEAVINLAPIPSSRKRVRLDDDAA